MFQHGAGDAQVPFPPFVIVRADRIIPGRFEGRQIARDPPFQSPRQAADTPVCNSPGQNQIVGLSGGVSSDPKGSRSKVSQPQMLSDTSVLRGDPHGAGSGRGEGKGTRLQGSSVNSNPSAPKPSGSRMLTGLLSLHCGSNVTRIGPAEAVEARRIGAAKAIRRPLDRMVFILEPRGRSRPAPSHVRPDSIQTGRIGHASRDRMAVGFPPFRGQRPRASRRGGRRWGARRRGECPQQGEGLRW
jgi:hypothetical protein